MWFTIGPLIKDDKARALTSVERWIMWTQRCIIALTTLGLLLVGWIGAVPAVAAAQPNGVCFAETGKCIQGRFLEYWQSHGGLALNGYPLSDERQELLEDGHTYTVQYFERVRMELHPENQPPYDVLLGQFGRAILTQADMLTGDFDFIYVTSEDVRGRLGRPIAPQAQISGATQIFERGRMFWRGDKHLIIVLAGDPQTGQLIIDARRVAPYFADTWQEGQDPGCGPAPTPGLYYPQRGFGKVWRDNDYVRSALGYARTAAESGYTMTIQDFERGVMLTSQTSEGQFIYVVNSIYPCNSCTPQGAYERFTPRSQ